ncbi:hypothetical protein M0805_000994 [Coniferiporia weirii]|nr:hypothetical protein M0805_000994 [Coniferiporia weirii]
MSKAGKAQGGTEQPVNVREHEKPDLTKEEQEFLNMLCRVLPKLVSGLEIPTNTGDPSPLLAQDPTTRPDEEGSPKTHQMSSSQTPFAEVQEDDSSGDQEKRLWEALLNFCARIPAGREFNQLTCWNLRAIIGKFKRIENRIRSAEGGAQLMDALVELEKAAEDGLVSVMTDADIYLGLKKHIVNVTEDLSELFETLIPGLLKAQEKSQIINYNNMLTAATFFSAVTATTLQLSYAYNTNTHASFGVAVNALWFVALVFSTASSLNSLVGQTWYQKIRRYQSLPNWVKLWLEYGPTISLFVASAAFSAGLCLFAFSSSQHNITSALTATFTIAHAVALFVPLCLYSPNRLSRFLLKVFPTCFDYCKGVCLRWWYLRTVPRQDRRFVALFMDGEDWSKEKVARAQRTLEELWASFGWESESATGRNAATSTTGNPSPDSSSSLIGVVKRSIGMAWMSVCSSVHSVVARLVTRWPERLVLRRRRTRVAKDSGNMEQAREADEKVVTSDELERGLGSQGDAGKPDMQKHTVAEEQDIAPSREPRTLSDITDPDEGAALANKGLGKEVGHDFNTSSAQESTAETAPTTFTANLSPCSSSSPMVQNSDNGFENDAKQAASTSGRPNASQEGEPEHPFDLSAQGVEAHDNDASNPTFKVGRRRRVTFQEGSPSAKIRNPDSLKR